MRVLFVGLGKSAVCYYRCALPAMFMGADWVGLHGAPPNVVYATGLVGNETVLPAFDSYDVVVLQQPRGPDWKRLIRKLQAKGVKVVYEIDDYVHGIRKMTDHDFRQGFGKPQLAELEMTMRACDAVICSTEYIAHRYRQFNPKTYVCENGIDLARYRLTRPPRPSVNVGWAGATGHTKGAIPWFQVLFQVMLENEHVNCVTIGQNFAEAIRRALPGRAIAIPFCMIDVYPAAMTMFDIALGPAGKGTFFRGKSDLRWVEAGALGVPIIADPRVYPKIEHGVTGFHSTSQEELVDLLEELVHDEKLRLEVGANAKEYVHEHRDMRVAVRQWQDVLAEVVA